MFKSTYADLILDVAAATLLVGTPNSLNEVVADFTASVMVLSKPDESPSILIRSGGSSLSDILGYSGVIPKMDNQTALLSVGSCLASTGASKSNKWSLIFVFAPWEAKMACIVAAAYQSDLSL